MGVAFVRGLQGDDPKYLKTVATSGSLRSTAVLKLPAMKLM